MIKTTLRLIPFVCLTFISFVGASSISQEEPIPLDPSVRYGKLDNGFTYYIKANQKPESRVELRLAVNAGSILESEQQRGLAHFCEHMAFNGSENFEKNDLVSFLQSIGVDFGPDINAYTSFDETVYMLTIPSDKPDLVDQGFVVMRDWAGKVSYVGEEIDKERGVIKEEWRIGRGANQRMLDQYLPVLLKDSQYAQRLPIGLIDVVEGAPHDQLRNFYKDWYRPDLMALVVVGDVNLDEVEKKIKNDFSDLIEPAKKRDRDIFEVPYHEDTLVSIATDSEANRTIVRYYHKFKQEKDLTVAGFVDQLRYQLFSGMLNVRLAELTQKAEPPFIYCGFYYGDGWARGVDFYSGSMMVADGGLEVGIRSMLEENKRALEGGFTASELKRQKANIRQEYERQFAERDKTESANLASQYVSNYLEDQPVPGIAYSYEVVKQYLDLITIDEVNALSGRLNEAGNQVFVITGPERVKEDISEEKILSIVDEVNGMTVEAYQEEVIASELVSELPEAGTVVSSEVIDSIDAKHVVLSNGVNLYLKKTDFKNDEILLRAYSPGGASLHDLKDKYSTEHASSILSLSGWGEFSAMNLQKFLAGKSVNVRASIDSYSESVSGSVRPQDLEEFFQLIHLVFTAPRQDSDSYQSFCTRMKGYLKNVRENPNTYFQDERSKFMSQNHPRASLFPKVEDFDFVDHESILQIHQQRFADADDFVFSVVGNFEEDQLIQLFERYIGCLPSVKGEEAWVDFGIRPPLGHEKLEIFKGQDEKSITVVDLWTEIDYTEERDLMLQALSKYLDIRYTEVLREELSGVYSVGVRAGMTRIPYEKATITIQIPSSPGNVEKLVQESLNILNRVLEEGISSENIVKVKEIMKREAEIDLKENGYWVSGLLDCARWGKDFAQLDDLSVLDSITSESIQKVLKECFNPSEYLQSTLYPESMRPE